MAVTMAVTMADTMADTMAVTMAVTTAITAVILAGIMAMEAFTADTMVTTAIIPATVIRLTLVTGTFIPRIAIRCTTGGDMVTAVIAGKRASSATGSTSFR